MKPAMQMKLMKVAGFGKTCMMAENIITAALLVSAMLFFLAYGIYSAAHNLKF